MSSRRIVLFSILSAVLLGTGLSARRATAVASNPIPVTVDLVGHSASGGMGTARNSTDGNQEISCWSQASGPTLAISCFAVDKNGNMGSCSYVTNPNSGLTLGGLGAIDENAGISFQWDANGNCTLITITNDAYLEPKL